MKNFVQAGENITVPAPADTLSGALTLVGALFGIATADALSGEPVTLVRRGIFELPKTTAQAWTVGDPLYFDESAEEITSVDTGNALIGVAVQAAANPSATGLVLLTGGPAIAAA